MSTVERIPDAMTHDAGVEHVQTWTGQLFFSFGNLARLNLETCCSALANAAQHCERLALARTAEQAIRVHAQTLPLLSAQIAAYTQGWFDILSMATTCRPFRGCDVVDVSHSRGLLDDMAWSAKGVDMMLRVISLPTLTPDTATMSSATSPAGSSTAYASGKCAPPAVPKR
ncbi:hypothetical protein [Paraburkholderia fungorum]|uniref:hypothetical protein n=1 Tax=Paraburkholderia fungorum TaxID=134537 RepID=UPI00115F84D4|nr:hypothetical protein [Paraburkholderia fungorum]